MKGDKVRIAGTPEDKRHGNRGKGAVMNVQITTSQVTDANDPSGFKRYVLWTCPKKHNGKPCLQRNNQRWYGRDDYYCIKCGQATNIKGESAEVVSKAGTLA